MVEVFKRYFKFELGTARYGNLDDNNNGGNGGEEAFWCRICKEGYVEVRRTKTSDMFYLVCKACGAVGFINK
jgi:hypothetical protein